MARRLARVLTPEQLQVAAWYYFDGLDQQDIADLMGTTVIAVVRRLNRIDDRLRAIHTRLPRRLEHPTITKHVTNYNFS